MKLSENLGTIFLSAWLIIFGVQNLIHRTIPVLSALLPLLAVLAGVFLLINSAKLTKSPGIILLAVWFILRGIWPYLPWNIPFYAVLLNGLAVVTGVLILLKR